MIASSGRQPQEATCTSHLLRRKRRNKPKNQPRRSQRKRKPKIIDRIKPLTKIASLRAKLCSFPSYKSSVQIFLEELFSCSRSSSV